MTIQDLDAYIYVDRLGRLVVESIVRRDFIGDAVNLMPWIDKLDWVIVGGESGTEKKPGRPCKTEWVRKVQVDCQKANVPFYFKQWGDYCPGVGERGGYCHLEIRQSIAWCDKLCITDGMGRVWYRLGKHRSGCLLDGREWKQYPKESRCV